MLTVVFRRRLYSAAELTSSINSLLFFINNVFFLVYNVNKGCGYYKMLFIHQHCRVVENIGLLGQETKLYDNCLMEFNMN